MDTYLLKVRLTGLVMFLLGVGLLLYNHWNIFANHRMSMYMFVFAPITIGAGLASLLDPRIVLASMGWRSLPGFTQWVLLGGVLVTAGVFAFMFWLYAVIYHVK